MSFQYKYEIHCHTSEGSVCGKVSAKQIVEFYAEKKYAGIVITDHFTGSTTVPKHYKWKDRVDHFFTGFEAAKAEGDKCGLDVFASLEYSDRGNDFLFYGAGKEFLLENPDMRDIGLPSLLKRVRDAGIFIIHAHPFLQADWIPEIKLVPEFTDAVQVTHSGSRPPSAAEALDRRARWYADEYGLIKVGGSDTHHFDRLRLSGIAAERKAKDIMDLVAMIKEGKTEVIKPEYVNEE